MEEYLVLPLDQGQKDTEPIQALGGPVVTLSALDQLLPRLYSRILMCFPFPEVGDGDHQEYDNSQKVGKRKDEIVSVLRDGLQKTITALPFLTAEVVDASEAPPSSANNHEGRRGRLQLRPGKGVIFRVRDLTHAERNDGDQQKMTTFPSYDELKAKDMVFDDDLTPDLLCPVEPSPVSLKPNKVMAGQVTFIKDGLILCICTHHSVVDGTSFGELARVWAGYCAKADPQNGGAINLNLACVDRTPIIESRQDGNDSDKNQQNTKEAKKKEVVDIRDFPGYKLAAKSDELGSWESVEAVADDKPESPSPSRVITLIFNFSAAGLIQLKTDVSAAMTQQERNGNGNDGNGQKRWISTNDAVCALFWSCITDARLSRLEGSARTDSSSSKTQGQMNEWKTTLGMAINARSRLRPALPKAFLGNVVLYGACTRDSKDTRCQPMPSGDSPSNATTDGSTTSTATNITPNAASLKVIASTALDIRQRVNSVDDGYVRRVISLVESIPDISLIGGSFFDEIGTSVIQSSWTDLPLYDLYWGDVLSSGGGNKKGGNGKAEFVRLAYAKSDGVFIILPRRSSSPAPSTIDSHGDDINMNPSSNDHASHGNSGDDNSSNLQDDQPMKENLKKKTRETEGSEKGGLEVLVFIRADDAISLKENPVLRHYLSLSS